MFASVLVANRGEVAVRIIRTLRRLGIASVAVYSDADERAPHVEEADTAVRLGPPSAAESYLHIERVVGAALASGAEAVHPGYGFLAERAAFARAVTEAGLVFVGPEAAVIELMGDKIAAKRAAAEAGVPVLPGIAEPGLDDAALTAAAPDVGYPLMVKAAAGGGGKGMRVVREPAALSDALTSARREAQAAFGDDALLLERFVERPRHIEVQVLADTHGGVWHIGERECSLQRRHQKVIEESPSPIVDADARERLGAAAVALCHAVGYTGAGTVEMVVEGDDPAKAAFLEMNTRLQVEHPVTELTYGVDLVELQLRVAAGERLDLTVGQPEGHAVEARIYAEDPARGFLPTGGRVAGLAWPTQARVDAGIRAGTVVGSEYDPMLAKVITHGRDRTEALTRLDAALAETAVLGVTTNVAYLRTLLADADVRAGRLDTALTERVTLAPAPVGEDALVLAALLELDELTPTAPTSAFAALGGWRVGGRATTTFAFGLPDGTTREVEVSGTPAAATVRLEGEPAAAALERVAPGRARLVRDGRASAWHHALAGDRRHLFRDGRSVALVRLPRLAPPQAQADAVVGGTLRAPLPGTVVAVHASEGAEVTAGETLLVVEAMKMEHPVVAPVDGTLARLAVAEGDAVALDAELAVVEPKEAP